MTENSTQNTTVASSAQQSLTQDSGSHTATITGSHVVKNIGRYRVEVIREKCISAASCVAIAPRVFQLDEEELAIILSQDGEDDDTKLLAAQSCPTAAIIVTDTTTGKQVWPVEE